MNICSPSSVYQPTLDRVQVFVNADNGHLYVKYWNGSAWIWEDQGTPAAGVNVALDSAVYQPPLDRIIVFVTGENGHLYDKYSDGSKWLWEDHGIPPGAKSARGLSPVFQPPLNRIICFVGGDDASGGHLYDKYWDGSKWVWEDQGNPPSTTGLYVGGAVYQPTLDRVTVFVTGTNGHLYDKYWNGKNWVWEDQGIPPGDIGVSAPCNLSAVYQPTLARIIVFLVGSKTGHLYDKYSDGSKWVWENQGTP
jgi:hypothetical protein